MQVILALLYVVVGLLLAAPHTYLAGGNVGDAGMTAMFAPIAALILFITYVLRRMRVERKGKLVELGWGPFVVLAWYFCLPILLNGASLVLKLAGCGRAGYYVFELRYGSLFLAPILFVAGCYVVYGISAFFQRFRPSAAAPPSSPPSDGEGPIKTITISAEKKENVPPGAFQVASA